MALLLPYFASAQDDSVRVYTKEHPLVYTDSWDLWPYSYLNDNGEPEGFNIDLIRMLMEELNIPYVIKLKPQQEAFQDLKARKSDLTLGLAVGFHDEFGRYGKRAITLFTQSVVTPKKKPVLIKTFRDLSQPGIKVYVNDSSLCHHLMLDYGWTNQAIVSRDLREVIQRVSAEEEGQIVWNTLSLKWLLHRYHIDNLSLTPVNMPHGEYKFMSHDTELLNKLDETYARLYSEEKITPLQDKWFYPEHIKPGIPSWIWYVAGVALLVIIILVEYSISFQLQSRRLKRANQQKNNRLALILETSKVRIWTYDLNLKQFSWHNEKGQVAFTYTAEEFSQRYSPEDFQKLMNNIELLSKQEQEPDGNEQHLSLTLKARDAEEGSSELRDFNIMLSVLSRDKQGKPETIIGTKKDITDERRQVRRDEERTLRYWSIFNTPIIGIILFNKHGILKNINTAACNFYHCDSKEMIEEQVTIHDLFFLDGIDPKDYNEMHSALHIDIDNLPEGTRKIKSIKRKGKAFCEYILKNYHDDNGELEGTFAFLRDISTSASNIDTELEGEIRMREVIEELNVYSSEIDLAIHESDIRQVAYSPMSHTLTIFNGFDEVQHALTQTRCMVLVDDRSKKSTMRMLNDMDAKTGKTIESVVTTSLRKGQKQLVFYFRLAPVYDEEQQIKEYRGLLRDYSEQYELQRQMAEQTAKVQEVENTKNSFVKNMVQEIQKPMNTVVEYVNKLAPDHVTEDEDVLKQGILDNADSLLHLIDNVLYLSRLEAKMVDIIRQPRNFADLFASQCASGWMKYQNSDTNYIVENPYEQLVVNIDAENLAHAIQQVTANAAQHTKSGYVRARYDYIGRRLIISIDDTGGGIPQEELERFKETGTGNTHTTKGLGLAITKELISQMGGTIEISSEEGSGTTVYIMLPCHASVIKRKKLA